MPKRVPVIPVTENYDSDGYSDGTPTGFRELPPGDTISEAVIPDLDQNKVTGLAGALNAKAPTISPIFTGVPTAPTAAPGTNTMQLATTAYVLAAVNALVASAPVALDTLNELAAALGNDANFAATITALINSKLAKSANLSDLTDAAAARANLGIYLPVRSVLTVAADESELIVTDALVSENSLIKPYLQTNDATAKSVVAVPGDGEYAIYLDSQATGEVVVAVEIFYQA